MTLPSRLRDVFDDQFRASRGEISSSIDERRRRLDLLERLLTENAKALAAAVDADFGGRGAALTEIADMFVLRATFAELKRNLIRWSKPTRVRTPIYLQPASARIERQPLGVVGIIGPWNYPLQLTLGPAATALAAGNRVMIKPSELTPCTSALLAQLVEKYFPESEMTVVQGAAEVAAAFAALPFDHLFFTGSTAVGRKVAESAARNLTPVTLELGGKSPCIVDVSCKDLADTALKIAHGKLLNGGQTCIAPDYLVLPRSKEAAFSDAYRSAVAQLFPQIEGNPDYAAIVNDHHHARLKGLLDDAVALGAKVLDMGPSATGADASRRMRPVLVFDVLPDMRLMDEEIFGPVLPVVLYDHIDEVLTRINAGPRPLALYWFGQDTATQDKVLSGTVSGGVTVNDTLLHVAHERLPFGGVGESGQGAYHGEAGFLRFTHQKSVLQQSRWAQGGLLYPPYGARFERIMAWIRKLL
ncbi:MAG: aldehyde dehydrogenase family protein [Comamonadaceae bacterium]|nr:aldehyde dehydrogenase family protein [Comamonadaceae bacterium]